LLSPVSSLEFAGRFAKLSALSGVVTNNSSNRFSKAV